MKTLIILAVVIGVGYAFVANQRKQQREALEEREAAQKAASEEMYKRQDERVRQQREGFYQQAKAQREAEIQRNAPERDRLAAKYPDLYRKLEAKVGGDLSNCIVTAREDQIMVALNASCGESLQEAINR